MKLSSLSRAEKRFFVGSALAVLLIGGLGWALWDAKNTGDIPPHAPMPVPNGFDQYVAAATALTRPNPPVDAVNDTKIRLPQEVAKFYTPARRAAFVASNAKTWSLMQQARAAQTQHPDVRGNVLAKLPYAPLRELARGKTIEAKHFKDVDRWDLALQSGLDSLEMGRDVEHGAPLIGSLVGIAVEAIGGTSIEDVPSHLSATEAKNGARRLERIIAAGTSPAEVLREEKWSILTQVKNNFGSKPNFFAGMINRPLTRSVGPMMDAFIAQMDKPLGSQIVPPQPTGFLNTHAVILYPLPKRYSFNVARRETNENSLLLRLALRAYRLENGAYSGTLTPLAPKYLAKVPRDPFGRGETLRYRKSGDDYLAWSIGPDGKDDSGQGIALKAGQTHVVIAEDSQGDAVIKP